MHLDLGRALLFRRADRARDIGLRDVGGAAGHGSYREILLSAVIVSTAHGALRHTFL
jgi:hypothetical protein